MSMLCICCVLETMGQSLFSDKAVVHREYLPIWPLSLGGTSPRFIIFYPVLLRILGRFGSDLEKHFPDLW